MKHIREIVEYRDMIGSLVRRELRGRYEKSVLGFLWSFLSPLFQILIYNIVFTQVFHNGMPNFYIYLMTGLLPWNFFSDSVGQAAGSIIYNAEMIKKIYFPREVLVIAEVSSKFVNMLLSFVVMAGFLIFSGCGFSRHIVLLPMIMLTEFLLALGFSFLISATTVYLRDLEYVVNVILMAWIWGTPVLYAIDGVQNPTLLRLLHLNPMTGVICSYHSILYYHEFPPVSDWLIPLAEGAAVIVIGYLVFRNLNKRFVEEL